MPAEHADHQIAKSLKSSRTSADQTSGRRQRMVTSRGRGRRRHCPRSCADLAGLRTYERAVLQLPHRLKRLGTPVHADRAAPGHRPIIRPAGDQHVNGRIELIKQNDEQFSGEKAYAVRSLAFRLTCASFAAAGQPVAVGFGVAVFHESGKRIVRIGSAACVLDRAHV